MIHYSKMRRKLLAGPRGSISLFLLSLFLVLLLINSSVDGKTLSVKMRFKLADEMEKAQRLKLLHALQIEELEETDSQINQAIGLISNIHGKMGSFPGSMSIKSSLITAPVSFGGQTFDLTLDTGSTILWVTSASCTSPACSTHRSYNASLSQTFRLSNPVVNFEVEYGSGSIAGVLASETVGLGDIAIPNQPFGLVTKEEGPTFENAQWSGLLGLAYPGLAAFENVSADHTKPFFDAIMDAKLLNQNAFSFWLVRAESSPPMFFLGAPPTQYYSGKLEFFSVTEKHYWTIRLRDILVDGQSLGLCSAPDYCKAVVDTGTSYMSAPKKDLPKILHALTGSTATSGCQHSLNKTITYVLDDDRQLTLEPDFYFTKSYDNEFCKVKYIGLDVDAPHGPLHIFGDVLFRKYFVHFDRDGDQVGFALAKRVVDHEAPSLQSLILSRLKNLY